MALLELGQKVSTELRQELDRQVLETDRSYETTGPIGPACLPLAAIAGVAKSLAAGRVFVLSDPKKLLRAGELMKIGEGFGAAVIGPAGKITGAVRFLPAGPLLPVAGPLLLVTTFLSMTVSARFDRIEKTLAGLAKGVDRLLANSIAETGARFLSAWERVADIHEEYLNGPGFTDEMKMRLVLAEKDVKLLRHKHHALATAKIRHVDAVKHSVSQRRLFAAATVLDAQVNQLRLFLALQDNPGDVEGRLSALRMKIEKYEADFRTLTEHDPIEDFRAELNQSMDGMGFLKKHLLGQGKAIRGQLHDLEHALEPESQEDQADPQQAGADPAQDYSILFWRDDNGAGELKAWYTDDYRIEKLEASSPPVTESRRQRRSG